MGLTMVHYQNEGHFGHTKTIIILMPRVMIIPLLFIHIILKSLYNSANKSYQYFAFDQNNRKNRDANEVFLLLKMIAYNLHNWFRTAILPEELNRCEIKTIRRKFYNLAANICGTGRYQHIRYACDKAIESLITAVIDRLRRFQLAAA